MPKNGFPMPTAKNRFQILNLHPNKYISQKIPFFTANLLEKFPENISNPKKCFFPDNRGFPVAAEKKLIPDLESTPQKTFITKRKVNSLTCYSMH